MHAATLEPTAAMGRWWAPRDAAAAPVGADRGAAAPRSGGAAGHSARSSAAARERALARIEQLAAQPEAMAGLPQARLEARRAALRGDALAAAHAELSVLAGAAAHWRRLSGRSVPPEVLQAALVLGEGGACALHRAEDRALGLALAAVAAAYGGLPCHLLAQHDLAAAAAWQALAPLMEACRLSGRMAASDLPLEALRAAYQADVVHVSARRLAADLAHDLRLRAQRGDALRVARWLQAGADTATLTRGLHTVYVDDLDRTLFDDSLSAVMLSVPDDAAELGPAVAAARVIADGLTAGRDYRFEVSGHLHFTAAGEGLVARQGPRLPPLWRAGPRRSELLTQALVVRDRLLQGRDYELAPGGAVLFDETLAERLPQRGVMTGLSQAVQARHGLPLSPIMRTLDRTSVPTLLAGAHRLGGVAPDLAGMEDELWRHHGLQAVTVSGPPRPVPRQDLWLPVGSAWAAAIAPAPAPAPQATVLTDPASHTTATPGAEPGAGPASLAEMARPAAAEPGADAVLRLFVLRRPNDAARLLREHGLAHRAWALEAAGPERALAALGLLRQTGVLPSQGLEIVFVEPLDSERAERAFCCRVADVTDAPLRLVSLCHPRSRLLTEELGPAASLLARLGAALPGAATCLLPPALRLARWLLRRRQRRQRLALMQRERLLRQQLSFAGTPVPEPSPVRSHGADAPAPERKLP